MKDHVIKIFWLLIANFAFIVAMFLCPPLRELFRGSLWFLAPFAVFLILGLILLYLLLKKGGGAGSRKFLILTASSAVGVFLSILLHNFVYGIMAFLFGRDFWERAGLGDEPFFFILAVIVFPALFVVGVVGTIITLIKKRK